MFACLFSTVCAENNGTIKRSRPFSDLLVALRSSHENNRGSFAVDCPMLQGDRKPASRQRKFYAAELSAGAHCIIDSRAQHQVRQYPENPRNDIVFFLVRAETCDCDQAKMK